MVVDFSCGLKVITQHRHIHPRPQVPLRTQLTAVLPLYRTLLVEAKDGAVGGESLNEARLVWGVDHSAYHHYAG